jgi:predicted RND superfamily exporter protein
LNDTNPAMPNFFERRDPWGHGWAMWVVATMAFCIPAAGWVVRDLRQDNEVTSWLASNDPQAEAFRWYSEHFPSEDVVLMTWDGSSLSDERVGLLAARLRGTVDAEGVRRGGWKLVDKVRSAQDLLAEIESLDPETGKRRVAKSVAIRRLLGVLVGGGPLRVRLSDAGRADRSAAIAALQQSIRSQAGVTPVISAAEYPDEVSLDQYVTLSLADLHQISRKDLNPGAAADGEASEDVTPVSAVENAGQEAGNDAGAPESFDFSHDLVIRWSGQQTNLPLMRKIAEIVTKTMLGTGGSMVARECFLIPGSPVGIALTLSEAGLADRDATFNQLREIAAGCDISADSIHLGGRAVSNAALNAEVRKAVWNPEFSVIQPHRRSVILLSWGVGLLLALWMLRSLHLTAIVLGVSYLVVLVTMALLCAFGGKMNIVLAVMPTLLMVTTLGGAIHLTNYWRQARLQNARNPISQAYAAAWTPTVWASLTTAIGLTSLLTSSLEPVRDFGTYSAIGMILAIGAILFGLPSLLQIFPGPSSNGPDHDVETWRTLADVLVRRWPQVLAAGTLVCGIGVAGLAFFKTETKVIRYFADHLPIVRDYKKIEDELSGIIPVEIAVRFDAQSQDELNFVERLELVRAIGERARLLPDVSGTLSLPDFVPVTPLPTSNNRMQRFAFARRSQMIEERVRGSAQSSNFVRFAKKSSDFNAEGDEIWRVTCHASVMSPRDYRQLTHDLDEICRSVLRGTSGRSTEKYKPAGTAVHFHPGASHVITGMVMLFMATQAALLTSLLKSFLLAFAVIACSMMWVFRSVPAGLLAMIPNVLPIVAVFGWLSWAGVAVDVGSVVTASVALGIAIDGTLHLILWFRRMLAAGMSRHDAIVEAVSHCGPAMWQTSIIIAVSLAMLTPSDLVLISRFGWLMAILIGTALVADVILTPALLAGPLGWILERIESAERQNAARMVDADELPNTVSVAAVLHESGVLTPDKSDGSSEPDGPAPMYRKAE